jgi:hypothetical protein
MPHMCAILHTGCIVIRHTGNRQSLSREYPVDRPQCPLNVIFLQGTCDEVPSPDSIPGRSVEGAGRCLNESKGMAEMARRRRCAGYLGSSSKARRFRMQILPSGPGGRGSPAISSSLCNSSGAGNQHGAELGRRPMLRSRPMDTMARFRSRCGLADNRRKRESCCGSVSQNVRGHGLDHRGSVSRAPLICCSPTRRRPCCYRLKLSWIGNLRGLRRSRRENRTQGVSVPRLSSSAEVAKRTPRNAEITRAGSCNDDSLSASELGPVLPGPTAFSYMYMPTEAQASQSTSQGSAGA